MATNPEPPRAASSNASGCAAPPQWKPLETKGFVTTIGPLCQFATDAAVSSFVAEAKHGNINGVVHGGMLLAFADQAMGSIVSAVIGPDLRQSTIKLDMTFISPAKIGDTVVAKCEVVRETRSIVFMQSTLKAGGTLVATANGIWKILRSRQAAG